MATMKVGLPGQQWQLSKDLIIKNKSETKKPTASTTSWRFEWKTTNEALCIRELPPSGCHLAFGGRRIIAVQADLSNTNRAIVDSSGPGDA